VFVALGLQSWGREDLFWLIPVLLFHEAGHYVAMKIFGYRNLKMFFIPLFGAAVSGRNYNVAGWKKVVVSMMGPAPGIMLGAMLGCLGIIFHQPALQKFSLLLLIINGFNLLPFIPLDGGWALQAIIFSRHFFFDLAFKIVAALAMLGLSIPLHARSLMYVGIATLATLPASFAVARTTTRLRQQGFVASSPDDQNIPDAVAETIITELKATLPKAGTAKNMARLTLQVFESLNAKPPGWAASLGLLAWYGGTVLTAVVFAGIVIVGQTGLLNGMLANGGMIPRLKCDCHSVKSVRHRDADVSRMNLVTTLDRPAQADVAFSALAAQLGGEESLEEIGQTLVLSLPSDAKKARQAWLEKFETYNTNAFVDWTNNSASFSFLAIAPNAVAASNITSELSEFFGSPHQGCYLIPPWTPVDPRSPDQQAADTNARRTYQKLISSEYSFNSPKLRDLQNKMAEAQRHGDADQLRDLAAQLEETSKQLRQEGIDKMRADKSLDTSVVDLYEKYQALSYTNSARADLMAQISKLMGVAADQHQTLTGAGLYAARTGYATHKALMVHVNFVAFADTFEGVPAFLDWLCAKGCIGIRYSVRSMPYYTGGESDDDL
jgi:Zn-dependent protease